MAHRGKESRTARNCISLAFGGYWQAERFLLDGFANGTAAKATSADLGVFVATLGVGDLDRAKVRAEIPLGFAGDFSTDTTKVLGFTAGLNLVADLRSLSADFTHARHDYAILFQIT